MAAWDEAQPIIIKLNIQEKWDYNFGYTILIKALEVTLVLVASFFVRKAIANVKPFLEYRKKRQFDRLLALGKGRVSPPKVTTKISSYIGFTTKPKACKWCKQEFNTDHKYNNHLMSCEKAGIENPKKEVVCCETIFRSPQMLYDHSKIHLWKNDYNVNSYWNASVDPIYGNKKKGRSIYHSLSYSTLQGRQFRLLEVLNNDKGKLRFRPIQVSLDSPPEYVALSYCWGQEEKKVNVKIGKINFQVSKHVEEGLRNLVNKGYKRIWIDRLCINQHDLSEKESQILRIETIFRNAIEVVVWLGPQDYGNYFMKVMRDKPSDAKRQLEHTDSPTASDFNTFLSKQYWTRTWIIQECAAAQKLSLHFGKFVVDWTILADIFDQLEFDKMEIDDASSLELVSKTIRSRQMILDSHPMSFLQALQYHRFSLVKKGHDKIFAVLGLCYDAKRFVTSPQYSLTLRELCLQLTEHYVNSSGRSGLDIIFASQKSSYLDLPSWCPDYLHVREWPFSEKVLAYIANQEFKTRLGMKNSTKWSATSRRNFSLPGTSFNMDRDIFRDGHLFVPGLILGRITKLHGLPGPNCSEQNNFFVSTEDIFESLCRLFILFHPDYIAWSQSNALKYVFAHLLLNFDKSNNVAEWISSMLTFKVFGRTIQQRATEMSTRHSKMKNTHVLDQKGVFRSRSPFKQFLRNTVNDMLGDDTLSTGEYSSFINAMQEIKNEDLRLMTDNMGNLGWVQASAKIGDEICLIHRCSMPVVLRRKSKNEKQDISKELASRLGSFQHNNQYTIVGYALVDGWMEGEQWGKIPTEIGESPDERIEWKKRGRLRFDGEQHAELLHII